MAEALISSIIAAGVYTPACIYVSDIRADRLKELAGKYKVHTTTSNAELASKVDILILSIKPQNMDEALESIKAVFRRKETLIISIAAGIKVAKIAEVLGEAAIVRVMPNTGVLIGEGASVLFANEKARPLLSKAERIFAAVGTADTVENEELIDVVTAVSGSGPAYFFLFAEEMVKAAIELGLPADIAAKLVLQTAKGSILLAVEADKRGESLSELREKVTSPGGTTEAALKVLADDDFGELIKAAIRRARDRSRELST